MRMKLGIGHVRLAVVLVLPIAVLGASPAMSSAPTPVVNVSCISGTGGLTTVDWAHLPRVNNFDVVYTNTSDPQDFLTSANGPAKKSPASVATPTVVGAGNYAWVTMRDRNGAPLGANTNVCS